MTSRRLLVCFIVLLLAAASMKAQVPQSPDQIRFQRISQNEIYGLGKVWDILEDHLGFIWFATEDGLFRYDGYEFEAHKRSENPGSISSNFAIDLHEDRHHNLWVGTLGGGLNLYNRNENKFYQILHDPSNERSLPSNRISGLFEDREGKLWVGTEGGGAAVLDKFDNDFSGAKNYKLNLSFTHYRRNPNPAHKVQLSGDFVRANIVEDHHGNIYIGTYGGGITIINAARDSATYLLNNPDNPNSLSSNSIYELLVDSKNRLWIGSENQGVDLYLIDEKTFLHYKADGAEGSLANNQIETMAEDGMGNIWIGTDNGLALLLTSHERKPANKFMTFKHQQLNEGSLLSNSIKEIYSGKDNSLWVGSYFGGINKYNPESFKFTPIRVNPWQQNTLTDNNITAMVEDKEGNLWIGTDGGGLNFLPNGVNDFHSNNYKYIEIYNPSRKAPELKIKSLLLTDDEKLWIGTWAGGLLSYNIRTKKVTHFGKEYVSGPVSLGSAMNIEEDHDGNIWVATFNQGVARYDRDKKMFESYLPTSFGSERLAADRLNIVKVDTKNNIWVGGEIGGLNVYDRENDTFVPVRVGNVITSEISVNCIAEARDGVLWLGTLEGIIGYNPETRLVEKYTSADGLVGDGVQGIIEDNNGILWISTTNGLTSFDRRRHVFTRYTQFDGLQGNNFNRNSLLKSANGMLFFGGASGWNGFNPVAIKKQDKRLPLVFTQFFLHGAPVTVGGDDSPLPAEINSLETISLDYDQNNFAVMFALLEYNFVNLANYSYKLEGLNDSWIDLGKSRMAAFTNLDPGKYKLRVKASNKDGYWHESPKPLSIVIHPAWWQTLWFKAFVVLVLGGVIYGGMRLRVQQLTRQRNKLEELVKERTASLAAVNILLNEKNNEIQAQNEELYSQNDQIMSQREELLVAKQKLEQINRDLESLVVKRTEHLNEVISKLDSSVKTLDRFVYSASHDLSAPMKTIRGLLHVASMEKDYSNMLQYFNLINDSIKRFEDVILSMTNFSRNLHHEVVPEPVDLFKTVDQIFHDMKFWPEATGIDLENAVEHGVLIKVDKYRLETILQNLIGNAIKYADKKKGLRYVKVSCIPQAEGWLLQIRDNGIGIKSEYIHKIFDMFFKASEKSQGSGLGLFIVHEAVKKINGSIAVDSVYGEGTTISITLPKQS